MIVKVINCRSGRHETWANIIQIEAFGRDDDDDDLCHKLRPGTKERNFLEVITINVKFGKFIDLLRWVVERSYPYNDDINNVLFN